MDFSFRLTERGFKYTYPVRPHSAAYFVRDDCVAAEIELVRLPVAAALAHAGRRLAYGRPPPRPWLAVPWALALTASVGASVTIDGKQRVGTLNGPCSLGWKPDWHLKSSWPAKPAAAAPPARPANPAPPPAVPSA